MKFFKITLLLFILTTVFASCRKTRGCTDETALNYNTAARRDDHSCYYYWIGQSYGGGKIFYVDKTRKHGLIAATFDLPNSGWGCFGDPISGADGTYVGTGMQNTLDIVAGCSEVSAASLCNDLDTLGYNDWYLPSVEELKGVYKGLAKLNEANFGGGYYWTSSEIDSSSAYLMLFANGALTSNSKLIGYNVRAIRAF